ncbi:deacetylase [Candidatus Woesearchaeota archaeon]|nr:deacetylase [Candidatus Woesearchaeota archaeon]
MINNKPAFIITIDVEGDNLWSRPRDIKCRNALFLPRFQELCEKYNLFPVYLTNYEMAMSDFFVEFSNNCIRRKKAEIGMHIHAWNSPPVTYDKDQYSLQPFLIQYQKKDIVQKIDYLYNVLSDKFSTEIISHRAGRWAINSNYMNELYKKGVRVDCSVTPNTIWDIGEFNGNSGYIDYTDFPDFEYFVNLNNIKASGSSDFLEVPMTIIRNNTYFKEMRKNKICRRLINRVNPEVSWLRPNGRNAKGMIKTIDAICNSDRKYAEFMIHSSELMPKGSPLFDSNYKVESLYEDIEGLFDYIKDKFYGITLADFYKNKLGELSR